MEEGASVADQQSDNGGDLKMANDTKMSKVSVEEKFQIEDSPWNNIQTQGVNFGDYKARVKAEVDKDRKTAALE